MSVFVTGIGVISALGQDVNSNFNSLINEQSGISDIEYPINLRKNFIGGEVKLSNEELKKLCGIETSKKIQRSTLLGLIAASEAFNDHQIEENIRTAVLFGTTIGGINISDEEIIDSKTDANSNHYTNMHDEFFGTDYIGEQLGIDGYKATISTACSTAANSILLGARMIEAGLIDRALVGGAEAITNYTLNGFDSLNLYDDNPNRPFDESRAGLNLGEGGAFLVLESSECQQKTKKEIIAKLIGWGNACDAFHQTASSPDGTGAKISFNEAIKKAKIDVREIDFINTHGTATLNNDLTESQFLIDAFNEVPSFSSTKSFTGHTLAAAGGIEAVYSILSLLHGTVFANLGFENEIVKTKLHPVRKTRTNLDLNIGLSSSFGFGGNCTQLIFQK